MDEARIQRLMSDPNVRSSMNEALNNPDFINMLIESNPMLRNLPNAREIITSPMMRQMMSSPEMMSQAMRMQRTMQGGEAGGFPAPGATDTTPQGAASGNASGGQTQPGQQNPPVNPFLSMLGGQPGGGDPPGFAQLMQQLQGLGSLYGTGGQGQTATGQTGSSTTPSQGTTTDNTAGSQASATTPSQGGEQQSSTTSPPPANPFAALFPPAGGAQANPFGMTPEMMQQMMQMMGGAGMGGMGGMGANPPAPADNRPPEERYAEQLRQLNDMGFFDFDRNVAALRRSGGSVQGAIEHLLSG